MKNDITKSSQNSNAYRKWKNANMFGVMLFVVVLGILGVVAVVLPKETVSVEEKRELAKCPKFTIQNFVSGRFTGEMDAYYADTFPERNSFIRLGAMLKSARGLKYDDITIHDVAPEASKPVSPEFSIQTPGGDNEQINQNQTSPQTQQPEIDGEKVGSMYVYKNAAMEPFTYNNNAGKYYASVINAYKRELGDKVKIYNLIIPTAAEFDLPDKYKYPNSSQKQSMQFIYSCLDEGIIGVDAIDNIAKHKDEYLFFRSDHHWTVNAAYYAYEAFAQEAGFTPTKLSELQKKTLPEFLGTLYAKTQDEGIRKNPDFVDYYLPKVKYTCTAILRNQPFTLYNFDLFAEYVKGSSSYSVFLQGDHPMIHINTSNKNGRSIVMVKESFGNAFAPFLVNNYEDVYVVDQRYFQTSLIELIRQNEIDELLFINNAFAANTTIRINEISRIMYQVYVPPVPEKEKETEENEVDEEKIPDDEKLGDEEDERAERRRRLTGTIEDD